MRMKSSLWISYADTPEFLCPKWCIEAVGMSLYTVINFQSTNFCARESLTVFQGFEGVIIRTKSDWENVSLSQREAIKNQVRGWIIQMATQIPNPTNSVRSLAGRGAINHRRLLHAGPFESTNDLLQAYRCSGQHTKSIMQQIKKDSRPVFSHFDLSLRHLVLHPNLDSVVAIVDWEQACFFPEAGRAVHKMCDQFEGWEDLYDGLEFPDVQWI